MFKKYLAVLLLSLLAMGTFKSQAQTVHKYPALDTNNTFTGSNIFNGPVTFNGSVTGLPIEPAVYTVSTLPTPIGNTGLLAYVSDGSSANDCTVGGGTNQVLCSSQGVSGWVSIGGNGSGSVPAIPNTNIALGSGTGIQSGTLAQASNRQNLHTWLVCLGDSRCQGPNLPTGQDLLSQIAAQPQFAGSVVGKTDLAVIGSYCSGTNGALSQFNSSGINLVPGGSGVPSTVNKTIFILSEGINGVGTTNSSLLAEESCYTTLLNSIVAKGGTVTPATTYYSPVATPAGKANMLSLNQWIKQIPYSGQYPVASLPMVFDYDLYFPPASATYWYNSPAVTGTANVLGAVVDGSNNLTLQVAGGGTLYTTASNVPATSNDSACTGVTLNIVASGGALVAGATVANAGTGCVIGDLLYPTQSGASGGYYRVGNTSTGAVTSDTLTSGGVNYVTALTYTTTSGSGINAKFNLVAVNGACTNATTFYSTGSGYQVGDLLYAQQTGASGCVFTVTGVTSTSGVTSITTFVPNYPINMYGFPTTVVGSIGNNPSSCLNGQMVNITAADEVSVTGQVGCPAFTAGAGGSIQQFAGQLNNPSSIGVHMMPSAIRMAAQAYAADYGLAMTGGMRQVANLPDYFAPASQRDVFQHCLYAGNDPGYCISDGIVGSNVPSGGGEYLFGTSGGYIRGGTPSSDWTAVASNPAGGGFYMSSFSRGFTYQGGGGTFCYATASTSSGENYATTTNAATSNLYGDGTMTVNIVAPNGVITAVTLGSTPGTTYANGITVPITGGGGTNGAVVVTSVGGVPISVALKNSCSDLQQNDGTLTSVRGTNGDSGILRLGAFNAKLVAQGAASASYFDMGMSSVPSFQIWSNGSSTGFSVSKTGALAATSFQQTNAAGTGSRCAHYDASGNLTATTADCGTGGGLAAIAADSWLANATGASAVPVAVSIPNCVTGLTYSTTTHAFGCGGGTGTVNSGLLTAFAYYAAAGTTVSGNPIATLDGSGNAIFNSVSTGSTTNGADYFTWKNSASTAPTTHQFSIEPLLDITTPWRWSPAQAPPATYGYVHGSTSSGTFQQDFVYPIPASDLAGNGVITINSTPCTVGSSCSVSSGSGTVNSGLAYSPAYYAAAGTAVSGTTPFIGLEWWPGNGAPIAATTNYGCAYEFGDSIMSGTASSSSTSVQSNYALTLPGGILTAFQHSCGTNVSYNGLDFDQIEHNEFLNFVTPQAITGAPTRVFIEGLTNDAIAQAGSGVPSANALTQVTQQGIAAGLWALAPLASKYVASTWTQTTGTWAASGPFGWNASIAGNELGTAGSGRVLTSPTITTTVANQKIAFLWGANTSSAGTFTVTLDGTSQTNNCTGTTTFASGACNFSNGNGVNAVEFTAASAGAHTIVVTTTSASQVDILGAILEPATPLTASTTTGAVVEFLGVPPGASSQSAAITSSKTYYDTQISNVVTTLAADGYPVTFANIRSGANAMNQTTDYTSTTNCYLSPGLSPDHPNCNGITKMVNAYIAAATPGSAIPGTAKILASDYPLLGNGTANWMLPIQNGFMITNTNNQGFASYAGFSSLSGPIGGANYTYGSATTHGPGMIVDTNGGTTFHAIEGSFYDTTASQNYGFGLLSSNGWLGENCTATSAGDSNCTKEWEVTSAGNLILGGSIKVATARKGTFTCTAGGTIPISNANELATSDVIISLNTAGGTITTAPAMKTVTAGTGFSVLCGASDTSVYNYDILN